MLERLDAGRIVVNNRRPLPPLFNVLAEAAKKEQPLEPVMEAIVRSFGFDSFMYGASISPHPGVEAQSWVFTTLPREWVMRYDQRAYIEVDPRILNTADKASPYVWDQATERGAPKGTARFLEDARKHGIASGVAMSVPSPLGLVVVAFNSSLDIIDTLRDLRIDGDLGDLDLIGRYFHDTFMASVVMRGIRPLAFGTPLAPQQRRCLAYVAHGYRTSEIAICTKRSERTVESHLCLARTKLGATNSTQAATIAVTHGFVRMGEVPSREEFLENPQRAPQRVRGSSKKGRRTDIRGGSIGSVGTGRP